MIPAVFRSRVVSIVAMVAFGALGCRNQKPASEIDGDAALTAALHTYVVTFLERNPTTNTYLGGAGLEAKLDEVDGKLRDYSPAAITAEVAWLTRTKSEIEAIQAATLAAPLRIDRDVALAQIAFQLRQLQDRRYQERALDTYIIEPFRAIDWQLQGMAHTGLNTYGTADEWSLVITRLQAVPGYLRVAETQLAAGVTAKNTPDKRMIQRDGLGSTEASAKYFRETLPKLAMERMSGPERDHLLRALEAASLKAAEAYSAMRAFVVTTYFENASAQTLKAQFVPDHFAAGEEQYNWSLKNNFKLETTTGALYDDAWPIVAATQQQMIGLARQIGVTKNLTLPADGGIAVRAVFDHLSADFPKDDAEMVGWYRAAANRLVEFGRKSGLFAVPDDYKLDVTETPPPLQASIDGAAYYPAPPFKASGVGRFYVTPTHNDQAALQSNNRSSIADLSAHEGFPGHDWYYKVLTAARTNVSHVRWLTPGAVEDSSSMWEDSMPAEGWALYSEALLAEPRPDSPNGFYTPEEHLYQLQGQLYRDLRVRVDIGIHTGRMTYDDAVTLFSEVVDFLPGSCGATAKKTEAKRASCESAERAIFRYSKWPTQAITYRLGKDQILALRLEASKRLGAKFSLEAFHLHFIKQGTIPPGYFRNALMDALEAEAK